MAKQDFLPNSESDLVVWYQNFSSKLTNYQVALGLTVGEVTAIGADYLLLEGAIQSVNQAKQEAKEWVAFKNIELYGPLGEPTPTVPGYPPPFAISTVPPGIVPRVRAMAARLKAHPAYTAAIGADLGIIGADAVVPSETKPDGTATALPAFTAEVSFLKRGFDGVDIESQRAAETAWTHLAFDAYSPYVDNRPPLVAGQAEQRRYRLRYRDADVPVGLFSDTLTVHVGP